MTDTPNTPELPSALLSEFDRLVQNYPDARAALIPMLHRCQEELGGWISPETMEAVATYLQMEPVEVYGVTSFYPMFRLSPPGKHVVSICHNISCDLRGAQDIVRQVCELTGAKLKGTSPDGKFTVQTVECQGACANAPMFDLDGIYHEDLDAERVEKILGGVE
jgi:NADH-quinone oxidoreductase subunit E